MTHSPAVIGIETAVTDYIYDEKNANIALRDIFLHSLKPEKPPRKGENILISAEEFEEKLLSLAQKFNLAAEGDNDRQKAESIRDQILGKPRTIEAGGALANSFYLMANAGFNNKPVIDSGTFLTAIGDDEAGRVFEKSLGGFITHPVPQGRTMVAHIVPTDGDRIIIALPSFQDSCDKLFDGALQQLREMDFSATRMVMLGGYMEYTGKYNDFLSVILEKTEKAHENFKQRPTIVFTAGAQAIAETDDLKSALASAVKVAPVIVCANAGEFRRLMGMDAEWRLPHNHKWIGLEGEALENAKQADAHYVQDKIAANNAAFAHAQQSFCTDASSDVTFVVTNGKHGVRIATQKGISSYTPPKPPHGIVNTVGGGDAFAGGYLLGEAAGLPEAQKAQLGFIAAGEVIGRDEARLPTIKSNGGASGLPAYLGANHPILSNLNNPKA